MTIHYKNPRMPKRTICGHDCTISGRTYSNVTNKLYQVNCKACLNAISNNKLIIERYSEDDRRNLYKKRICDLISGSVIDILIHRVMKINIERPYNISRLKGTYVLFEKGKRKLYVGSTIDIRARLASHRQTKPNIMCVIFLKTKDMTDALFVEDYLITNLYCSNKRYAICHHEYKGKTYIAKLFQKKR